MKEGWLCPRCNKVNAPWVSQCSCKDFYSNKNNCNLNITEMYLKDNWATITNVNSDSIKTVPSV